MRHDNRTQRELLIERPDRKYSNLNNARRGIMIYVWKKENTLYVMLFINLTDLLCWVKVKKIQPIWSVPWIVTQVISSVLYRVANRKRSMVMLMFVQLQLIGSQDITG